MTIIAKTPKFDFIMDFMDDAERDKIKAIIKGLDKIQNKKEFAEI